MTPPAFPDVLFRDERPRTKVRSDFGLNICSVAKLYKFFGVFSALSSLHFFAFSAIIVIK